MQLYPLMPLPTPPLQPDLCPPPPPSTPDACAGPFTSSAPPDLASPPHLGRSAGRSGPLLPHSQQGAKSRASLRCSRAASSMQMSFVTRLLAVTAVNAEAVGKGVAVRGKGRPRSKRYLMPLQDIVPRDLRPWGTHCIRSSQRDRGVCSTFRGLIQESLLCKCYATPDQGSIHPLPWDGARRETRYQAVNNPASLMI